MDRWRGKVAVVTGASAGIGLAIVKALICQGLTVVGLARRLDKMLNELKIVEGRGQFFARECDVSKEQDVVDAFNFIKDSFKTVHILVNNAGILVLKTTQEAEMKELQQIINVNLVGLLHCSKQAIKLMKENDHEAHIININSIAGHKVPNITLPNGTKFDMNIYSPTKFAVTSLSNILSNELVGGKIRITSLSPGYVRTDMGKTPATEEIHEMLAMAPHLKLEDVADAILYILGTPHHVQITELIIQPLGEYF